MCPSDLLLLDEPTNHLDLDAILWLEDWLKGYPGTLLLISHDRDFLDAVVDHVVHVEQRKLNLYKGGYTAFERTRAERLAQQQQAYEKQQAQRAHMEKYIARFKAQATKARQAQSRIKALERMEELSAAHVDSPFDFVFRESQKISSPLLDMSEGRLGYGDKAILEKVKLQLVPGARIGLLGPNGAGKSTLIKNLAGELEPLSGRLVRGENLAVGYFAQHQLDSLDDKASPLLHLQRIAPTEREQTLRDFLGGFDFHGDRVDEPVVNFSGGEKARLALALIAWERPNLLLLDEPTNHLDLEMRLALTMALQEFAGAVVVVSHDRHLLKSTTDDFLLVADGKVDTFDGDLEDYSRWLVEYRQRNAPVSNTPANPDKTDKKAQRQAAAALRQQLAPHKKAADKLEAELNQVHAQLAEIETALGDSGLYEAARKDELRDVLARQSKLKQREGELEEAWMEALETLESMQAELEALS
jgi:ATP-binding cassette subfamily F protein 3